MLWARLVAYVTGTMNQEKARTLFAKRISGGGEPDPERADPGSAAAFGRRKGDTGRDRSPPGSNGSGGRGGLVLQLELIFRSMLGAGKPREWKNRHALVSFFVFWVI